jgi:hypothetical protein
MFRATGGVALTVARSLARLRRAGRADEGPALDLPSSPESASHSSFGAFWRALACIRLGVEDLDRACIPLRSRRASRRKAEVGAMMSPAMVGGRPSTDVLERRGVRGGGARGN